MQIFYIELHPGTRDTTVELRFKFPGQGGGNYEPRQLPLREIQDLLNLAEGEFARLWPIAGLLPDPISIGQQLLSWIDGPQRSLSRAIEACEEDVLVLAIANHADLPQLPWEVLHDRSGFLIDRAFPKVLPVRWLDAASPNPEPELY